MKLKKIPLVIALAASSFGLSAVSFGFTAVTNVAGVTNTDIGAAGGSVGDSFTVMGGSFASYLPGLGDPTITGGDLAKYLFNMSGTITNVNAGIATYAGLYEIFYDGNGNGSLDLGAGPPDFSYSSGTLNLTIDFTLGGPLGPFAANGMLHQTAGPDFGFPSTGFAGTDATFSGSYTQNANDANGTIQGTVRSVPDGGSSLLLLGLATLGTFAAKRRLGA